MSKPTEERFQEAIRELSTKTLQRHAAIDAEHKRESKRIFDRFYVPIEDYEAALMLKYKP
jgi:hypothetical protein